MPGIATPTSFSSSAPPVPLGTGPPSAPRHCSQFRDGVLKQDEGEGWRGLCKKTTNIDQGIHINPAKNKSVLKYHLQAKHNFTLKQHVYKRSELMPLCKDGSRADEWGGGWGLQDRPERFTPGVKWSFTKTRSDDFALMVLKCPSVYFSVCWSVYRSANCQSSVT